LLVRYMDGELEPAEKANLESRLAGDAELREELDRLRLSRKAVQMHGLRELVASIHREEMTARGFHSPVPNTRRILRLSISVAAAIVLLVAGIAAYSFYRLSPERVYAAHYLKYELPVMRGGEEAAGRIEADYRAGKYAEVLRSVGDTTMYADRLLAGMSAMELKNFPLAIEEFRKLLHEEVEIPIRQTAEYYLSLAYISDKDYDLALEMLQKIQDESAHLYREKVTSKLLRQVRLLKWR